MSFFDSDKEIETPEVSETPETPVVEKIKVGDEEYDPGELQRLVSLGKIGKEAEEKFNTDLTKVWPEYSKTKNELKKLQEMAERPMSPVKQEEVDEQIRLAQVKLREMGFMTKEDYQRERDTERLLSRTSRLEKEIDGSDGRPAFRTNTVLEHMVATGIKDPRAAYKDLYENELDSWKTKQLTKSPRGVTTLESTPAKKEPERVKITSSNLRQMVQSVLGERERTN